MFDLAASKFNCGAKGLAIIEIWLCLYIKFNGNIKILMKCCDFDFFRFRCKSTHFRCDYHVISVAILIMHVWRMRKHSTIVSKYMDFDRTHCCCQVGTIIFLVKCNSSRSDTQIFRWNFAFSYFVQWVRSIVLHFGTIVTRNNQLLLHIVCVINFKSFS